MPWNLHEPERGVFNFEDQLDLELSNDEGKTLLESRRAPADGTVALCKGLAFHSA